MSGRPCQCSHRSPPASRQGGRVRCLLSRGQPSDDDSMRAGARTPMGPVRAGGRMRCLAGTGALLRRLARSSEEGEG
eukprot:1033417-Alexandrium_andersonii.AAC.1